MRSCSAVKRRVGGKSAQMRGKGKRERESEEGEGDELDDSLVVKVRIEKKGWR